MKPIILSGHSRPVNKIKYNRDGDIFVSSGTDKICSLWYSENGERIGTFEGHQGSVNSSDINYDSTRLITGASDSTACLWELNTGKLIHKWEHKEIWSIKHVEFSLGDKLCLQVADSYQDIQSTIKIYDIFNEISQTPKLEIAYGQKSVKFTQASWGFLNESILASDELGNLFKFDVETGKLLQKLSPHHKKIYSFSFDQNKISVVTASDDNSAKLFDYKTLTVRQTYNTNVPVRSATISPVLDQIAIAGGQAAKDVTTTRVDAAQFSVRLFHKVYGDEIAKIKGHFGPIHSLAYSPDGKQLITSSEDSYIRINQFDPSYFEEFSIEKDIDELRLPEEKK